MLAGQAEHRDVGHDGLHRAQIAAADEQVRCVKGVRGGRETFETSAARLTIVAT